MSAPASTQQQTSGWQASLDLRFACNRSQNTPKTLLSQRQQYGPLAIQRPFYPEGEVCHAYVLHPPGGVVGGDQLSIQLNIETGAHALLTTPGATKFYRSNGKNARQQQLFKVSGKLEWLPQENIFFPTSRSQLHTHIHLEKEAAYLGWEIQCLGRPAIGERFEPGQLLFSTRLYRAQQPLLIDQLAVRTTKDLTGLAGLRGQPVVGMLVATPADISLLEHIQAAYHDDGFNYLTQGHVGISLLNEVLVVRYLGGSSVEATQLFRRIWQTVRPHFLQRPAVAPRIWNT